MPATQAAERSLRRLVSGVLCCAAGVLLAPAGPAWGQGTNDAADTAPQSRRDVNAETIMKITAPFTVAAVGDVIEPQPIYSDDPRFQQLIQRIRKADVGFANMESSLVDFQHFEGPVGGTEAPIEVGAAIKAMGITLMNHANNHTFDGGVMGMMSTDAALDRLGIAHAGTGMDLQQARAARYQETPKGRVGLVGMYSVDDWSAYGPTEARALATARNGEVGGAPGEDPLHLTAFRVVTAEQMNALKAIASSAYGIGKDDDLAATNGVPERFQFFNQWYETGSDPGALHYEMSRSDERGILQSIRNGKVYADFMIVTVHAHQTASYRTQGRGGIDHTVPDFLIKLAHDSIDNGADMFVVHGMHALRGVEIYKGKPIFYDVANFVFQFGLQLGPVDLPTDQLISQKLASSFADPPSQIAVLTTSHFNGGKLTEVRLYPVDLGGKRRPISQMGIPMTPDPQDAQRILHDMQEYSQPFGTKISIEDNVGVIRTGE